MYNISETTHVSHAAAEFTAVYEARRQQLVGIAARILRRGNRAADAEDLVQDVAERTWKAMNNGGYELGTQLPGFMITSVVNAANGELRRRARKPTVTTAVEETRVPAAPTIAGEPEFDGALRQLGADTINPDTKEILRLKYSGWSNEAIATQMNMSLLAVKGRIHRIREYLRHKRDNPEPTMTSEPPKKENNRRERPPKNLGVRHTLFEQKSVKKRVERKKISETSFPQSPISVKREVGTGKTILDRWSAEFNVAPEVFLHGDYELFPAEATIWHYLIRGYTVNEIAKATVKSPGTIRLQLVTLKKIIKQQLI